MIIYKTTNLINGKIYIGKDTKNNTKYFGSGILIERSIKKYGKDNFKKEILEYCTIDNINDKEKFWIKEMNSQDINIGYNISKGGDGGIMCDISKLSGENHYLNQMSEDERETHLNTFRRGINYWKSKGFETIEEIENWIKENWCGENHSHKKYKTEEEYKKWFETNNVGENFIKSDLKGQERKDYFMKVIGGKNNPIYRGKTDEEIEEWLDNNRRGENAGNAKYEYTIIKPDGIMIKIKSLKTYCIENNYNYMVLFHLVNNPKRIPKKPEYRGWKITKQYIK